MLVWKQSLLKAVLTSGMLLKLSLEQQKYFKGPCFRSPCNVKYNTYYCFHPKPSKDCWTLAQTSTFSCPSPKIYSVNQDTTKRLKYFPGRARCPHRTSTAWPTSSDFQCFLITWYVRTSLTWELLNTCILGETIHRDKWTKAYLMF